VTLARWDHPALGPVPPSTFVPLAGETVFIVPLNRSEPTSTALVSTIIGPARTMGLDELAALPR
jgi:predicted signal transduction protein with EAL and GGDEF domain